MSDMQTQVRYLTLINQWVRHSNSRVYVKCSHEGPVDGMHDVMINMLHRKFM